MRITEKDLKPGDVLLYNGTSWISWFIKHFDGASVSHAAPKSPEGGRAPKVSESPEGVRNLFRNKKLV